MISAFNFSFRQRIKLGINNTLFGLSGTIFNFVFSIIVVRLFSAQLWGSFAKVMLLITLLSQLTGWGNRDFLLREFSRSTSLTSLWQTSLFSRVLIFIPLVALIFIFNFIPTDPLLFSCWLLANFLLRSFDSVIVFERKFKQAIAIELAGFATIAVALFMFRETMTLRFVMILFIGSSLLKSAFYIAVFQKPFLRSIEGTFSAHHLMICLPYFLPPFIGFLQAKADTFAIAIKLSGQELGKYYVLLSLLSYCHAIAVLAITPFLKNIYRINSASFQKIKRNFILAGMAWSIVCIFCIYLILTFIYRIYLPLYTYGIAWLALPPYFIYYLLMQQFLRQDKPYAIVVLNLVAAILNFIVSLILIDQYGFVGGLLSCTIMQWGLLVGFLLAHKLKQVPAPNTSL